MCAQGFDPDRDLVRIGLANQTTMLRDETMAIGKMLETAMMQKHGPAQLQQHYMVMDTICDATQARVFLALAACVWLPLQPCACMATSGILLPDEGFTLTYQG